ncbi:hypothetical protein OIU78_015591 [Salix suchowensis]|nr:hypothetical protein OIU78_015591 [Salix suchowensis]
MKYRRLKRRDGVESYRQFKLITALAAFLVLPLASHLSQCFR